MPDLTLPLTHAPTPIVVVDPDTTTPAGRLAVLSAVLGFRRPRLALLLLARRGDPDAYALLGEEPHVVYEEVRA